MNTFVIDIIGLGVSEQAQLTGDSLKALQQAQQVIGWERHKSVVDALIPSEQFTVVKQLKQLKAVLNRAIEQTNNTPSSVAIVASGDPLFYGIGQWLMTHFYEQNLRFHPAISSIQAACHKQGISLQHATVWSLHGRPLSTIRTRLKRHRTLILLTDKNSQPHHIAKTCHETGFDASIISVHERLGYSDERSSHYAVTDLLDSSYPFDPLHITILEVKGSGDYLPKSPGIPDEAFITGAEPGKGMISKREVRLLVLSMLQPDIGDTIWDIGAGCGGVTVELSYFNPEITLYAIEHHQERLRFLQQNCEKFGVSHQVNIVPAKAPEILSSLPNPDKVFIGGSDGELEEIIDCVWPLLPDGGSLIASAVLDQTKITLTKLSAKLASLRYSVESTELTVRRGLPIDNQLEYIPRLPVTVFKFIKEPQKG